MEKDLLDISGEDAEDYWLLKNTPNKEVKPSFSGGKSGKGKSYFDSSPLQIPRSNRNVSAARPPFSPIGRVTSSNNMEQASQSIDTGTVGKENSSGSKVEQLKLSVERQQMKKKKKNAGFNMRKSLAWDRAFSTEEGVLDPSELSKISGGDLLPAIQEDFRESESASKCSSVSLGLRALEENLFSDLPSSCKRRGKKTAIGTVPKYTTPLKAKSSLVEKHVTPAKSLSSGSKRSGCPRPPPSSSYPFLAYSTGRELGIPKVSTTKLDPATVASNMKRTVQSPGKPKISQPTMSKNSQRSLGSVSFSKSNSSTYSKPKSSLASKSSIPKPSLKQARRNVIIKTLDVPSVSSLQHSVAGKPNDSPVATSDVDMLGHASNFRDSTLAQSSCSRVGNTQSAVSRLGKPSGLRLPSPSIGYFSKSDSQPSQSAEDTHSQLPTSDPHFSLIPTFKKPQYCEKVTTKSATGKISSLGSATRLSGLSIVPKPSQERVKVDLKRTREIESKVSSCSSSSQINDTGKLVLDDVVICRSEKISAAKCEDFESSRELPPSVCKNDVQDGNMSGDNGNEKSKSCCSVEGPLFQGTTDSPVQDPSGNELTLSQLQESSQRGEEICTTKKVIGDIDTLYINGKTFNECVHPGDEEESRHVLTEEKAVIIVNHSTENVAKQPEALDSFTAESGFLRDFASRNSDVGDLSSSGPAEAPDSVQSSCDHLEENAVSSSYMYGHNMACDGEALLEPNRIEVSDSTETNCEAGLTGPFQEQHFLCQLVHRGKEGSHDIDVLSRNERADTDDGSDMQKASFTGSPNIEQNLEEAKLLMPSSVEVKMEDKPVESSHEPFSEKITSGEQMQYNCSSVANTFEVKASHAMNPADQLRISDGCCPAKDVSASVFSCSNDELEDTSELEDMDLVTESDCSDEEPEDNLKLKEVVLVTESELISDHNEFYAKVTLNQEYPKVDALHTASDQCGKTKTLLRESIGSPASIFGDPGSLNEDKSLSQISADMSKENPNSGSIEYNYVEKAEIQTDAGKHSNAQVTDREIGSNEEEKVQVIRIPSEALASVSREQESGTLIPNNEASSVNVLSNDTLTPQSNGAWAPQSNGAHASENSENWTCSSESKDKTILMGAKLEKKPDPLIIKPLNAIPFSDEWLAAIEAAGEGILTLKSGRVQHSPTEKVASELGPWSPVKKKNNQGVGPFDCTKYTNKGLPPASLD
ncbi:unnamed protein product [Cochlearia groenlandica]